nr:hypothetical protein [Bifidobacterium lemurum]
MRQLEGMAFEIGKRLLVFAHAMQMLVRVGVEGHLNGVSSSGEAGEITSFEQQRAAASNLFEHHSTIRVKEAQSTCATSFLGFIGLGGLHGDSPVMQSGHTSRNINSRTILDGRSRQQRPVRFEMGTHQVRPHPHAIASPRLDAQIFAVAGPNQRRALDGETGICLIGH